MEETQTSAMPATTDSISTMNSKIEALIDIPFHKKIITALIALFNYFDIHAPNIPLLNTSVTWLRLFQLVGGSMMTAKDGVFRREGRTFSTVNIASVFFHLVPVSAREGNELYILIAINALLVFFGIYLIRTAFLYKATSKVSMFSVKILAIFMAFGPYLLLPCAVQCAGQLISEDIGSGHKTKIDELIFEVITLLLCLFYVWILVNTYTNTIIFRASSFASLEGAPQNKIFVSTLFITLICALSTHLSKYPSTVIAGLSFIIYIFDITTVFNCGTFIRNAHQVMILGGSIMGIALAGANIYPCFVEEFFWDVYYFIAFAALAFLAFGFAYLIIHMRIKKDLRWLDEIEETRDITIIKSKGKLKQLLITGFNYCHPICLDFTIFKLAVENWRDEPDVWFCYAKFVAIYPENTSNLLFIIKNVDMIKKNPDLIKLINTNLQIIINTRETKFTPQLRNMINKIQKKFIKAKNRLRNIWDLVLQGSTNDMDTSIAAAYEAVKESESEAVYLKTIYPNNRFARKVYAKFLYEVKGDSLMFKQAVDDLGKLQAGLRIAEDKVHVYGIDAFPNLPDFCKEVETSSKITSENTESIGVDDSEEADIQVEQVEIVSKMIRNNKIPAIGYMRWTTIFAFIFLFLLPLIFICVFFIYYEGTLEKPLHFMQAVAEMRNIISIIPAFVIRLLCVEVRLPSDPDTPLSKSYELIPGFTIHAFGDIPNARGILYHFSNQVGYVNEQLSPIRSYEPNNEIFKKIRDKLFKNNLVFLLYLNSTYLIKTPSTVPNIAFQMAANTGKLMENKRITVEIAKGLESLTSRYNSANITYACNDALTLLTEHIRNEYDWYWIVFYCVFGVLSGFTVIFMPLICYLQVRMLTSNKQAIYKAMSDLPKAVLSQISSSFNKIKPNESSMNMSINGNEQEINRQEESIIKLFTTISDSSSSSSGLKLGFLFFLMLASSVGFFYISVDAYAAASEIVVYKCHHINFMYGASGFVFSLIGKLMNVAFSKIDPILEATAVGVDAEIAAMKRIINLENTYFNRMRLGGNSDKETPFLGMAKALEESNNLLYCTNYLEPPKTLPQSTRCFSAEQQMYVAMSMTRKMIHMMDYKIYPNMKKDPVIDVFQVGAFEMLEAFFYPTASKIIPTIKEQVEKQSKRIYLAGIIFAFVNFVIVLTVLFISSWEKKLIVFTLEQFLRCPPQAIIQNPRIMELLAGNYAKKNDKDLSEKFIQFANEVINKLNDIFIVVQDETSKIILVNNAFEKMFDMTCEEVIGKNIKEFFSEKTFTKESEGTLTNVLSRTVELTYKKSNNDKVFIEFSVNTVNGRRIYTGKDQTQNIMYEKLLEDEKKKSDKMLSSILPANLVPRVQAGEKNISFAVQSVSVLFLDIVEFTPWCGSHDAQYVMRMLNLLFKDFDAKLATYKTMTKIKCIGDCYMAAGGIFDEVNQPAIHSKEVVEFGRDTIQTILDVNQKENEKLRIRVGINTGGPIVAGVIGTEKPTFEILGPAINIAHEMEHHGVPMKVHISRPVYELIYGQNFDIKERGEIEVKGGRMFTYLVEP